VGSTGNVITRGDLDLDDQHGVYAAYIEYNGPARLWGCEVSPDNWDVPTYGLDSTCGGSITVSILFLNDDLRLSNQSQLIMRGTQFGVDGSPVGGIACTTGVDCVAVTPEPVTIALVGTGLTGIGLLRRRRRREPS